MPSVSLPWYSEGLNFTCTACGNCCTGGPGFVWISEEEIHRLAEHLSLSVDEVYKKYCRKIRGAVSLKELRTPAGEHPCIFLDETIDPSGRKAPIRKCKIYHVRPLQCRTWPFWDGNLESPEGWESGGKRCPGMTRGGPGGGGTHFTLEQIEALRTAEDWPERKQTPGSKLDAPKGT
jgi:uncharacterized protein